MNDDREEIRERLAEELAPLRFGGQDEVLRKARPAGWRNRISAFWNKELMLPLQPLALCVIVFVIAAAAWKLNEAPGGSPSKQSGTVPPAQRQLIEIGGNMYWKDLYDRAVKQHAH